MKAAVLIKWENIETHDLPSPKPGPDELLIKVGYAGICGSDVHIYRGNNPIARTPVIPGHEFMGTIIETGSNVNKLEPGQRVVIQPLVFCGTCTACNRDLPHICEKLTVIGVNRDGGFADAVCVPADSVFSIPAELPDEAAAMAEPFSIAMHALQRGELSSNDQILVIGAGPIGFYTALTARKIGVRNVLISEPMEGRRKFVETFGFKTIDPTEDQSIDQALKLSGDEGYDLIVETSGFSAGLDFGVKSAAIRARIVTLGFPAENYAEYNITSGIVKELSIVGSRVCTRPEFADTLKLMEEMHRTGFDFSKLIVKPRPLTQLENSINDVANGNVHAKILITPNTDKG